MKISVNNQIHEFAENPSVKSLIAHLFPHGDHQGIALAVNQQVVSKQHWINHIINENDKVDIIRATQGG